MTDQGRGGKPARQGRKAKPARPKRCRHVCDGRGAVTMRGKNFSMPRAKNARGKVRGALPRTPARGTPPETPAPFPLRAMFQNGPRRPGCATENLFKSGKDFPPPRTPRAPWTAAGRSEELPMRRERGQMQTQNQRECARPAASRWSASTCRGQANLPCCEPAGADKQFTEECLHKILDRS